MERGLVHLKKSKKAHVGGVEEQEGWEMQLQSSQTGMGMASLTGNGAGCNFYSKASHWVV